MLLTNNVSIKEVILFPQMKTIQPGDEEEETGEAIQKKQGTE